MITLPTTDRPAVAAPKPDSSHLVQILTDLYARQFALNSEIAYLHTHGTPKAIRNHVQNYLWYERFLPRTGAVLDWGCNHAPDSCLLRARFGDQLDLHGCDFRQPGDFPPFHDYSGMKYQPLKANVALPYADKAFDAVIGSGTLEHTAMDYESLKELYRVMEVKGLLVITYLPNRWSIQEWSRRTLGRPAHRRLYGLGEICQLLKRTGFYPIAAEHQAWDSILAPLGYPRTLSTVLRCGFPIHKFSSTLRVVARKMRVM